MLYAAIRDKRFDDAIKHIKYRANREPFTGTAITILENLFGGILTYGRLEDKRIFRTGGSNTLPGIYEE